MFLLKTKQRRQTDGEALVQCSLDGFHVLGLNIGGKWQKLAETGLHNLQLLECMGAPLCEFRSLSWAVFLDFTGVLSQTFELWRYSSILVYYSFPVFCRKYPASINVFFWYKLGFTDSKLCKRILDACRVASILITFHKATICAIFQLNQTLEGSRQQPSHYSWIGGGHCYRGTHGAPRGHMIVDDTEGSISKKHRSQRTPTSFAERIFVLRSTISHLPSSSSFT